MLIEALNQILLEESVEQNRIIEALKQHRCVTFRYDSTDGKGMNTGKRFVVPFSYGVTKAGNPVLRGFQPYGDTTTQTPHWKLFRLDRIKGWKPTNKIFTKEQIDSYNSYGEANYDGDRTMANVYMTVSFNNDSTNPSGINTNVKGAPETAKQQPNQVGNKPHQPEKPLSVKTSSGTQYKQGDVIPFKELLRRSTDNRVGVNKSNFTKKANQANKRDELPKTGPINTNNNTIKAKDQASQQLSGISNQLSNNPRKIDLSQFDNLDRYGRKINEAKHEDFDFNELISLDGTLEKFKYCEKYLGKPIGSGSSRVVFQMTDEYVLKLAGNNKGFAQNKQEVSQSQSSTVPKTLIPYIDYENSDMDGFTYIVSEYVLPAKPNDFKVILGVTFNTFTKFVSTVSKSYTNIHYNKSQILSDEVMADLSLTQTNGQFFFHDVAEWMHTNKILPGDVKMLENWGLTKRKDGVFLVLLDNGLTDEIYNKHYNLLS